MQTDPLRLSLSGDARALPILSTVIASVARNTKRAVEVVVYTRAPLPTSFVNGRLSVEFLRAKDPITCGRHPRVPSEMLDRFHVIEDKPEWSRVLILDWDQLVIGDLEELWSVDFEGMTCALVDGNSRKTFANWFSPGNYPEEMPGRDDPAFRLGGMFNLERCRTFGLLEQMRAWVQLTGCVEQAALNAAIRRAFKPVDVKWNTLPKTENHLVRRASILHWPGGGKPWSSHRKKLARGGAFWLENETGWGELKHGRVPHNKRAARR